jgi:hypothetical protein
MRESRRAPSSAALTNCRELGLQGRVGEGVSTFVAQSLVQIVAFRPLGVGALTSLNKGFGDLEIRWSGFRREKPTPVVHERWAAFWSHPLRSVKPIERPFMAQSGHWLTLTDGGGFDVVKKTKDINCLGVPREFRTLRTSALMIGLGVAGK